MGGSFEDVLAAAQAGGEWAIARLYRELRPPVVRYFRSRAHQEAEDLAAETLLDVARGLRGFSGCEGAFRSWVFTIAHRRLVDHRRAVARRPVTTSMTALEDTSRTPVDFPTGDDTADDALAGLAGDAAVQRIVKILAPDQAEIVLLRVVAGLGIDEVARITGRRPGTVSVLQHRALRRLAERLKNPDEM